MRARPVPARAEDTALVGGEAVRSGTDPQEDFGLTLLIKWRPSLGLSRGLKWSDLSFYRITLAAAVRARSWRTIMETERAVTSLAVAWW